MSAAPDHAELARPAGASQGDATSGRPRAILVRLRGASVRFGPVAAIRDVELDVRAGDVIAVVGANGSGKTTLLRLLHGLVEHDGERTTPAQGAVQAMVFQRPFLLRLSVWNNLRIALWMGERRTAWGALAARAEAALRRVGLDALRSRPARALSGGEQQRLALARAWALHPDILFLDEPTANLDPSARKEVEVVLAGFVADGMTLVFSTHDLAQAQRLATRIVYLDQGRVDTDLPTDVFFATGARGRVDLFLKGELKWSL